MTFLKNALSEILGLFVNDGALALWSLALIGVVAVLVKGLALPPLLGAGLLTLGCLVILAESVLRAARRKG